MTQPHFRHTLGRLLLWGTLLGPCAAALSSCVYDKGEEPAPPSAPTTTITLRLRPMDAAPTSRTEDDGTWTPPYDNDPGDSFDSQINPNQVWATIYSNQNVKLDEIGMVKQASGEYRGETQAKVGTQIKVMVQANTAASATGFSQDQLTAANGLPMWGVTTSGNLRPSQTEVNLGTVDLLRSCAKLEVNICEALLKEGYSLRNITISKYASSGNVLPNGYAQVASTQALSFDNSVNTADNPFCFNPVANAGVTADKQFALSASSFTDATATPPTTTPYQNGRGRLYLPEMNPTDRFTISLDIYKKNADDTESLYQTYQQAIAATQDFPDRVPERVVRNHFYVWTIQSLQSELELEYYVCPWHQETVNIPPYN